MDHVDTRYVDGWPRRRLPPTFDLSRSERQRSELQAFNREDFAWRDRITRMIQAHRSLQEMADELNRAGVRHPSGAGPWAPQSVRDTYATS